ncbi:MAG: spore germination protein GerW family protein [Acidimicrobiia bacterium]|nr:spore germination protein GerW family protein [Acidimicrobiia bacterium]
MSKLDDILEGARDSITVRRVYGDPYEKDGVTFIPAAAVRGGGGGGEGEDANSSSGSGGGFGVMARPVGAYRIKDGEVSWVPAADTTKVIIFGQVVAIVGLLVLRSILRSRSE